MNFKLYIFGKSSKYKQYPDDSTDFKEFFLEQQTTNSVLNIKRKADLVYYIYTCKIDKDKKSNIGFCLVFNGLYIKETQKAFSIFEKVCKICIQDGNLFKIYDDGEIDFVIDVLESQTGEFNRITNLFDSQLDKNQFATLPQTYKSGFGKKSFSFTDNPQKIGEAISIYDSISIPRNSLVKPDSGIILKKKKRHKKILIVSLITITLLIGFLLSRKNKSLYETEQEIDSIIMPINEGEKQLSLGAIYRCAVEIKPNSINYFIINIDGNRYEIVDSLLQYNFCQEQDNARKPKNKKEEINQNINALIDKLLQSKYNISKNKIFFVINEEDLEDINVKKGQEILTNKGYSYEILSNQKYPDYLGRRSIQFLSLLPTNAIRKNQKKGTMSPL